MTLPPLALHDHQVSPSSLPTPSLLPRPATATCLMAPTGERGVGKFHTCECVRAPCASFPLSVCCACLCRPSGVFCPSIPPPQGAIRFSCGNQRRSPLVRFVFVVDLRERENKTAEASEGKEARGRGGRDEGRLGASSSSPLSPLCFDGCVHIRTKNISTSAGDSRVEVQETLEKARNAENLIELSMVADEPEFQPVPFCSSR